MGFSLESVKWSETYDIGRSTTFSTIKLSLWVGEGEEARVDVVWEGRKVVIVWLGGDLNNS